MAAVPPPPSTEKLDNDVRDIYRELTTIRSDIVQIDTRLDGIDTRLASIERIQGEHGERFESIEGRLDTIEVVLDNHSGILGEILGLLRDKA